RRRALAERHAQGPERLVESGHHRGLALRGQYGVRGGGPPPAERLQAVHLRDARCGEDVDVGGQRHPGRRLRERGAGGPGETGAAVCGHGEARVRVVRRGRGLWILDDVTVLRQLNGHTSQSPAILFKPPGAYRMRRANLSLYGAQLTKDEPQASNPPFGAIIDYYLRADASAPVTLEILDADGQLVRRYSSSQKTQRPDLQKLVIAPDWVLPVTLLSSAAGMHRFVWDLHYALPPQLTRKTSGEDEDFGQDGLW